MWNSYGLEGWKFVFDTRQFNSQMRTQTHAQNKSSEDANMTATALEISGF